jgi:hypothetical protein
MLPSHHILQERISLQNNKYDILYYYNYDTTHYGDSNVKQ